MMTRIRRARSLRSIGWLLPLWLAACSAESPPPNIVLISIDSLRADRLGIYGAERDTSPAIDALAATGVLFEHTVAPSSWTLPSHVTLMTGLSTAVHRVNGPAKRIDPARRLLAEALREHGYRTAAFVSAPYLDRAYGFDRGFDDYVNLQAAPDGRSSPSEADHDRSHLDQTAAEVIDGALDWLRQRDAPPGEPWFLFVHLWDVHYDYLPPAPYDGYFDRGYGGEIDGRNFLTDPRIHADMSADDLAELRALYDRELRALDAQLARLLLALEERGDVLIALVSDHGDEFFEHGSKGHARTLFEESVRVPWIVKLPGGASAGLRVTAPASLEDVAPTLLALAGLPEMTEATGRDLSPLMRGAALEHEPVLLMLPPFAALRARDWKLIVNANTGDVYYFDLRADPGERRPLDAPPAALRMLQDRLVAEKRYGERLTWQGDDRVELDEATAERLRELGYAE